MRINFIDEIPKDLRRAKLYAVEAPGGLVLSTRPSPGASQVQVRLFPYKTDFQARNHGIIDPGIAQGKSVFIIGVGSGGSLVTLDLVRGGVGKVTILDPDTVEVSNICRSPYDLFDVGRPKVEALAEKIHRINPQAELELHQADLLEMKPEKLMDIILRSDVIVEGTDDPKTKLLVNGLAHSTTPVVYPGVYDQGQGGDILVTQPGCPCFECVFESVLSQMEDVNRGEWDYSTGKMKPMSSLISDIGVVVARTSKLVLALLMEGTPQAFLHKIKPKDCSMLFIGNESDFFIFDEPFQERWATTQINPECMCQLMGVDDEEDDPALTPRPENSQESPA